MYKDQRGLCALSGRKLTKTDMQLDHIIPESRGGTHAATNLRWVCQAANDAKKALMDAELMDLCRDILRHGARPWM